MLQRERLPRRPRCVRVAVIDGAVYSRGDACYNVSFNSVLQTCNFDRNLTTSMFVLSLFPPLCACNAETVKTFDGNTGCRCRAGFGSVTGQGACTICPVGTFSEGGSNDACLPCPFGHTSPRGAQSRHQCEKMSQPCPVGQIAPPDAVSAEQCGCAAGFGGELCG